MLLLTTALACSGTLPPEGMVVSGAEALQAVGDVDHDGTADLLAALREESTSDGYGSYYSYDLLLLTEGLPLGETWDPVDEDRSVTARISLPALRDLEAWVVGPGDLDGDLHADLFIGSCGRPEYGGPCVEHSAVVWGRGTWDDEDATDLDLTVVDDGALPRPYGLTDLNGDGLADLLGGTPEESPTDLLLGSADRWGGSLDPLDLITWAGETGGLRPLGDVDGDRLDDVLSQGELCELYWKSGAEDFDAFSATSTAAEVVLPDPGWGRVTGGPAGDLDGDGIDDWWLLPGGGGSGCTDPDPAAALVLVQGRSGGPDLLYAAVWAPPGDLGVTSVHGGGDLDDDGHADLVVLYNSDADERGGWELVSGADVVFGSPGHLLGPSTWEDTYVTGSWWLGNVDGVGGDELAVAFGHASQGSSVRVVPGGRL